MPIVGGVDVCIGVLTLVRPIRAVILYMAFRGLQMAALRPLAGPGIWEFLERAGNYGVTAWCCCSAGDGRCETGRLLASPLRSRTRELPRSRTLRITTACLLIGHGAFDFAMHKDWSGYAAAVGITPTIAVAYLLRPFAGGRRWS